MFFLIVQLSEESYWEENSELYFCFCYDFADNLGFSACKMANGIGDYFNVYWSLFWKSFFQESWT